MDKHRKTTGGLLLATISALALAGTAAAADVGSTVVARGLDNPRGLTFGPDGALYVAEAGRGGKRCAKDLGCFGATGGVAKVTPAGVDRVVRGMASGAGPDGTFGGGLVDVTFDTAGGLVGVFNGLPPAKGIPALARRQAGRLARVTGTAFTPMARLDTIEFAKNPDGQDKNPNPYGVERLGGAYYVIDAGGNDVLEVKGAKVRVAAVLKNPAKKVQPVPTSIVAGPDGALYISELAPGPGVGQIIRLVPGGTPEVVARGLPSATGIAVAADRTIYLATFGTGGEEARRKTGTVLRFTPDGQKSVIARGLDYPAGMALGPDGDLYVANGSTLPGTAPKGGPFKGLAGEVVKLDLP